MDRTMVTIRVWAADDDETFPEHSPIIERSFFRDVFTNIGIDGDPSGPTILSYLYSIYGPPALALNKADGAVGEGDVINGLYTEYSPDEFLVFVLYSGISKERDDILDTLVYNTAMRTLRHPDPAIDLR